MRIALVTPYSWTYEGGVNRHTQALAEHLLQRGNEVRVLAPWDPPDRLSRTLHRGAPARPRPLPDYLTPLGRTVGFHANGSVSNVSVFPDTITRMRDQLRRGCFDVVHVQEPPAPVLGWDATAFTGAPVVGTFHAYSTKAGPNTIANLCGARRKFNQLHTRIAVSEAAAWTGRRWYGGEYEIIPNGVDLALAAGSSSTGIAHGGDRLEVLFVGRSDERKGLPVLLRAFEALAEHIPCRLVAVGVTTEEVERHLPDPGILDRIDARGRVSQDQLWQAYRDADVLCAPSLSGESFGMVLTEAFAAGTPALASAIAGYSDVVSDGHDGLLVPVGDPQSLAEELLRLHYEPERIREMGTAARESAERYSWPRVAARVECIYERALATPMPVNGAERFARQAGMVPADGSERIAARRLPSLDPALTIGSRRRRAARRVGLLAAAGVGAGLTYLAAGQIGFDNVVHSAVRSDLAWVLIATALMALSLFFRSAAWFLAARAALPSARLRRRDFTSATMIGVLMSATLPARLGEPARAMIMARRLGRVRESFPVLLGTLVSQTVLNILALVLLGVIIVSSTDLFSRNSEQLFLASMAPALLLVLALIAPTVVRRTGSGRIARTAAMIRDALLKVRSGLAVFRDPRRGPLATATQLTAWAIQVSACYALAVAMGLTPLMGIGGAAAVLFAVNVTAVIPATPSNIGIFQLAVISVLTTGYGVSAADALAYGVILQAVEIATAVALGLPALVREGMTWSDVKLRTMSATPVRLKPHSQRESTGAIG
ncbi:MAG: glycosyltransferase [Solirubrobacterales bacterium]|nr:MAG: glycosyltransferase [Solirubrobacterales bacterium]